MEYFLQSTLEDYEQVPIEKYGEAMLRGMGWQPGKGIGKNEKYEQFIKLLGREV